MFAIATLVTLVNQVSGTPYISGGDSPAGTDCSGLVSWVTNAATGRPVYGDRFNTGNIESALRARGFQYGTQPGALVVGWNGWSYRRDAARWHSGVFRRRRRGEGRRRWRLPETVHPSHVSADAGRAAHLARCPAGAGGLDGRAGAYGAAATAGRPAGTAAGGNRCARLTSYRSGAQLASLV